MSHQNPQVGSLLTESEASRFLNISVPCLRGWRQRSKGPFFIRLGRAIRYRRSDLEMYLRVSTVGVSPDLVAAMPRGRDVLFAALIEAAQAAVAEIEASEGAL